ncbi:hypothetical protein [Megalodesulfovibrio paquesii]
MKFLRSLFLIGLLIAGAAELAAWLFCTLYQDRFRNADLAALVPTQERLDIERDVFHPELGWKRRFPTAYGQRPQARLHDRALLATYGDSFTYGDEVLGFETWQTHLAALLDADVLNFGNGGYGPDQAYLRFLQDQPAAGTPYVVLSLIGENIARVVNVYRRFYLPEEGNALTKPRFHLESGRLVLEPNPTPTRESRQRLLDPAFLEAVGQRDYWHQRHNQRMTSFPYSTVFLRVNALQELINNIQWMSLWDEPEPRELMLAILDAFIRDARAMGARPIVAVLPMQFDLLRMAKGGGLPDYVRLVGEHCRSQGVPCFDAVSAMAFQDGIPQAGTGTAGLRDAQAVRELFRITHYSPLGNERLALAWFHFLRTAMPGDFAQLPPISTRLRSLDTAKASPAFLPRTRGVTPLWDAVPAPPPSVENATAFAARLLALGGEDASVITPQALEFAVHYLTVLQRPASELAEKIFLDKTYLQRPGQRPKPETAQGQEGVTDESFVALTDEHFVTLAVRALWGAPPSPEEAARLVALLQPDETGQGAAGASSPGTRATRADIFYEILWDARFRDRCASSGVPAY